MIKRLKFYGFYNFKKLKGGFPTDYDETSIKDHYFKEKFSNCPPNIKNNNKKFAFKN